MTALRKKSPPAGRAVLFNYRETKMTGLTRHDAAAMENIILTVRGQKVILDADLARIYGVPTKRLNEQIRRNADRFLAEFAFQLVPQEVANLRSQIATSSLQPADYKDDNCIRPQFRTISNTAGFC
jgi:hypothetical protein